MQEEVKAMDKQREKLIGVLAYAASDAYSIDTKKDVEELADFILADEEIKHAFELLKAEKEGKLIMPPCKVGDIVLLSYSHDNLWRLNPITVCALIYGKHGFVIRGTDCGCDIWELHEDRIGKDVFLNCEDAEKALEERRDK